MSSTALAAAKQASTPVKKTAQIAESPGNWKHPRLAEITRRQNASVFSEANIQTIVYNVGALAIVLAARLFGTKYPWISSLISEDFRIRYAGWIWLTLQAIPVLNIINALLPLTRQKDSMDDIALTPAQRQLLGLPPSSTPATPGSAISTPPRYSRTPSMSGSVGSAKSYASSPLSGRGSPAAGGRLNGSQNSPVGSPLFQKAVTGGVSGVRKGSFGSGSPLSGITGSSLFHDGPSTPTPAAGKRSSVGLNSKWLYEKSRRGSGGGAWLQ